MRVAFEGVCETVVTFETDKKLETGTLVNIVESGKVEVAKANSAFVGVVKNSGEKEASVQIKGYARVKFEGQLKPNGFGLCKVCTGENGKVKVGDAGREVILCDVSKSTNEIGIVM